MKITFEFDETSSSTRDGISSIFETLTGFSTKLNLILDKLSEITQKETFIKMTLDELSAKVTEEDTVVDSAVTLLGNLSQMLKDAIASGDPAKVTAIANQLDTQKQKLADAVVANTPAA